MDVNKSSTMKSLCILILAIMSMFAASCGGGDDQRQDQQQTDDSAAKQAAIDEANRKALERARNVNVAPQLQITAPANGATVASGPLLITWTAIDDSGTTPMIEIRIRNVGTEAVTPVMPSSASTGSFTWNGYANLPNGDYEIQLTGSDGKLTNTAFSRIKK